MPWVFSSSSVAPRLPVEICKTHAAVHLDNYGLSARENRSTLSLMRRVALFVLLALGCVFTGCAKPLLTCPRVAKVPAPPLPQQHPAMVLFATDRLPESLPPVTFLSEMNFSENGMSYGAKCEDPVATATVTVHCDEPEWLQGKPQEGLQKAEFLGAIHAANSDVVLFVHGFNYSFDESLQIALRIVQRTGVQAIPVAYSWPSQNRISAYGVDYDRNEWTIEHLLDLIQEIVSALPEGKVLHIVAHSMGNRAVLAALSRSKLPEQKLGQLVMIAPDVDSEIFKDLVLRAGPFQQKTLYVSNHDWALRAAGWLRPGAYRAGDARKQYVVVKGVDTVDMSPLSAGRVGHSVYDYSQSMFDDLGGVLKDQPPATRKLNSCTVNKITDYNATHNTQLPCVVYRFPPVK